MDTYTIFRLSYHCPFPTSIDPINQPPYYYSFVAGGSYKLSAKPESNYSAAINDGGIEPLLYEAGSNKKLSTFQSGLVLYLPFDEGSGITARDLSGFGNNGTLLDASSTNADGNTPPQWTTGKVGGALSFDGVDDYVKVPSSTSLYITKEITLVAWAYSANFSGYQAAVSFKDAAVMFSSSNGGLFFRLVLDGVVNDLWSSKNIATGTWYLLITSYRNGQAAWYINGQNTGRWSKSGLITNSSCCPYILIGNRVEGLSRYWNGLIDEVRIYNRALSDSEIKALYDATK
jgi:hypothetical protein